MPAFLETDRLVLRGFTEADADHLYELNSDRDVMWFLSAGEPTPREEVRDRIIPFFLSFYERYEGLGFWAAETRGAGEFLGWFHLRPAEDGSVDLGYRLRKAAWNRGYATEGSRALIRKCFTDLGVHRVVAHTMAVNHPSRRVMEKCGLALVRSYHSDDVPDIPGADQGEVEYALTREQWQADTGIAYRLGLRSSGAGRRRLWPVPYGVADQNTPQQVQVRLGKRERLLESGAEPYPVGFERTATAAGLGARYADLPPDTSAGEVVSVAGRVMLSRNGGKLCFAMLISSAKSG
jgi:RimJ/RimL family protein N-acetyltransferase